MKLYLKENVLEAGLARIGRIFDDFETVVVAFSGGKDSTVTLNLALQVATERGRLPLPVMFIDQEAEWQSAIDHIREVMNDPRVEPYWLQMPLQISNGTSADMRWLQCWEEGAQWIREKEPNSIHVNTMGTKTFAEIFTRFGPTFFPGKPVARLAGVRAQESAGRLLGVTQDATWKDITWAKCDDRARSQYVFYPIYDWGLSDVWKAIHEHKWPYCNTAEAPIWMGDYSFKRIEDVRIGDIVIGFTEPGEKRSMLTRAQVVGTRSRLAPIVKITMQSGRTIRCTEDHEWLRNPGDRNGNWRYGPAQLGDYLAAVVEPWEGGPLTQTGAWLGGMYDGGGCEGTISQSRSHNPSVCERLEAAFKEIGVPMKESAGANASKFRIMGGRTNLAKFVDRTRPTRAGNFDSLILTTRFRVKDRVVSIEPDGVEAVFALKTTTENYIAWGYASKNCKLYDYMYQYGVRVERMRVSNVHHETAINALTYMQEIEPDTWNAVSQRVHGVNAMNQASALYSCPKQLPPMFESWKEYRDYLLEKLIVDPQIRAIHRSHFDMNEKKYDPAKCDINMIHRAEVVMVLVNDYHGTKMQHLHWRYGKADRNRGTKGDRFTTKK